MYIYDHKPVYHKTPIIMENSGKIAAIYCRVIFGNKYLLNNLFCGGLAFGTLQAWGVAYSNE